MKKTKKEGKHEDQHGSVWEKYAPIAKKLANRGANTPESNGRTEDSTRGVKLI